MSLDDVKKKAKLSLDEMIDIQSDGNMEKRKSGHPAIETRKHLPNNTHIQSKEKLNCKITFNTTEKLFDEFNEIYAKRIIEKRKTDKSALLNEALELLIEKEKS